VTKSFDSIMRAEIAFLHDRVTELERQFEEARTYGEPAELHRLRPLLDEARQRWADAAGMPELGVAASALQYQEGEGWHGLNRCQDALDHLLYQHGGDGMRSLEVVEAGPNHVTLVGETHWVVPIDGNLVEATFTFDPDPRAIRRVRIRAGGGPAAKHIADRPETDDQWAVIIRAPTVGSELVSPSDA
jgi:hypothetical protein